MKKYLLILLSWATVLSVSCNKTDSENKKDAPDITYSFEDEKMAECTVTYLLCSDKFDQMKDDWARALNLMWKQKEIMGYTVYAASCRSKECNIIAQQGNASGFGYMTIRFQYETIFFD